MLHPGWLALLASKLQLVVPFTSTGAGNTVFELWIFES